MIMRHRQDLIVCVALLATRTHWPESEILNLPLRRVYTYLSVTKNGP
jgi:hypothetical protein